MAIVIKLNGQRFKSKIVFLRLLIWVFGNIDNLSSADEESKFEYLYISLCRLYHLNLIFLKSDKRFKLCR